MRNLCDEYDPLLDRPTLLLEPRSTDSSEEI